jgi:hypothetical protein
MTCLRPDDIGAGVVHPNREGYRVIADTIAAANLTTARAIKDFVRGYRAEGCDELILFPTVSDVDEVDRLAEVLG